MGSTGPVGATPIARPSDVDRQAAVSRERGTSNGLTAAARHPWPQRGTPAAGAGAIPPGRRAGRHDPAELIVAISTRLHGSIDCAAAISLGALLREVAVVLGVVLPSTL